MSCGHLRCTRGGGRPVRAVLVWLACCATALPAQARVRKLAHDPRTAAVSAPAQAAPAPRPDPSVGPGPGAPRPATAQQAKVAATGAEIPVAADWLSEPAAEPPAARSGRVGLALFTLAFGGATAAAGAFWQRRRRVASEGAPAQQIQLLAVRALGSRERLALVEVAGERLLLASCDGELSLLSHLPAVGGAEAAAEGTQPLAVPAPLHASAPGAAPDAPASAAGAARIAPPPAAPCQPAFADILTAKNRGAAVAVSQAARAQALPANSEMSSDLAGLRAWKSQGATGVAP